jgi:hypothetical protein
MENAVLHSAIGRLRGQPRESRNQPAVAPAEQVSVYTAARVLAGDLVPAIAGPHTQLLPVTVREVIGLALADGHFTSIGVLTVPAAEILAVAIGVPLAADRSSRRYRVTLRTGPYSIEGSIYAPPDSDPIAVLRHRSRIELAGAVIEYRVAGRPRRDRVPGLSVTRDLVESMVETGFADASSAAPA